MSTCKLCHILLAPLAEGLWILNGFVISFGFQSGVQIAIIGILNRSPICSICMFRERKNILYFKTQSQKFFAKKIPNEVGETSFGSEKFTIMNISFTSNLSTNSLYKCGHLHKYKETCNEDLTC